MFVKTALINGYQQRVFHGSHLAYEAPEIMRMSVWVCKRGCYSDGLDPCPTFSTQQRFTIVSQQSCAEEWTFSVK